MKFDLTLRLCSADGTGWTCETTLNGVTYMAMGATAAEAVAKLLAIAQTRPAPHVEGGRDE